MAAMAASISTARIALHFAIWFGVICATLFGAAGTLAWREAWLYVGVQVALSASLAIWLKRHNPELLQNRMTFWHGTAKGWDKAFILVSTAVFIPWSILPGLDAVRFQWSQVSLPVKTLGFAGILVSSGLICWVTRANPYLSRIVEVQRDRGHRVITTGPYRYVRHPMYGGAILWLFSVPLALGSLTTLIPSFALAVLIIARTYLEEATLHQDLEGYAAYAEKVRYRLVPGLW
jgi:protein-S-isoprenylcysteine O-methyltransferase Ste14